MNNDRRPRYKGVRGGRLLGRTKRLDEYFEFGLYQVLISFFYQMQELQVGVLLNYQLGYLNHVYFLRK